MKTKELLKILDQMDADFRENIKQIDWLFDMIKKYNIQEGEKFTFNGKEYICLEIRYEIEWGIDVICAIPNTDDSPLYTGFQSESLFQIAGRDKRKLK